MNTDAQGDAVNAQGDTIASNATIISQGDNTSTYRDANNTEDDKCDVGNDEPIGLAQCNEHNINGWIIARDIWYAFLNRLPINAPYMNEYDMPYSSDTIYPEQYISRMIHVLMHRNNEKEHMECVKAFSDIMDMIDSDTKTVLRALYLENVNCMLASALRLQADEEAEKERYFSAIAPLQLRNMSGTLSKGVNGPPIINAPIFGKDGAYNANEAFDLESFHHFADAFVHTYGKHGT